MMTPRPPSPPRRARHRRTPVALAAAIAAAAGSCARPAQQPLGAAPQPATATPAPPQQATAPAEAAAYYRVSPSIFSGPQPEGDEAFENLKLLGVRTLISVDGGRPDVERARRHGLRYVHLPTGYDGITPQRQAEIARAVRDLRDQDGGAPVYVHCHHGQHRGPAAAASAAILLGEITVEDGVRFLEVAGTSPNYPGLWSCVRDAGALPAGLVDRASSSFPEVAPVPGFVEAMVEADNTFDHLRLVQRAGWRTPHDHPDLVPAAEAARLADLLRTLRHDPRAAKEGSEFRFFLLASAERAQELETAIVSGAAADRLDSAFTALGTSCRDCHVRYRN